MLCSALGVEAKVSNTVIDSCATASAVVYTPISTTACEGEYIALSATIYPNVSSQWYKDGQPLGQPNTETVYATESGIYHLEVTNALLQCNHSYEDIAVQINPLPEVYAGEDFTVCQGDYVEFIAQGASSYVWSNGIYNGTGTLIYNSEEIVVIGTNVFGCSNSDTLIATAVSSESFYYDGDGDGFGTISFIYHSCFPPLGYVANSLDCNDLNFNVNISAPEICNNSDDNCNSIIDEDLEFQNYYIDIDSDGYGNIDSMLVACAQPLGFVANSLDCNDMNVYLNTISVEICNNTDDNCNGFIDEGLEFSMFYFDGDLDGFGKLNSKEFACAQPQGFSSNSLDCDDMNFNINPAALEICNNSDENCNGLIDDGLMFNMYYLDSDLDGFGSIDSVNLACAQPLGYVNNSFDCNDSNFSINASVVEVCNDIDDDCNGEIDNGLTFVAYYADADGDTYGDFNNTQDFCLIPSELFVTNGDDCDDANALINPAAVEIWENGIDDDCDPNTSDMSIAENPVLSLSLFPNPAADKITVTMPSSDVHTVEIFNALGQLVHTSKIFGSQVIIDVSVFPKGNYVIRVKGLTKVFAKP